MFFDTIKQYKLKSQLLLVASSARDGFQREWLPVKIKKITRFLYFDIV